MRTLIIYFSKTCNSEKVAKQIAQKLNADLWPIECKKYGGERGDILAGIDNILGRKPRLANVPNIDEYDQFVLGGPIWLGKPSAPIRASIEQHLNGKENVGLFVCGMGPDDLDSAATAHAEKLTNAPKAILKTHSGEIFTDEFEAKITEFCKSMKD